MKEIELTPEQKANFKKIEEIFSDEANQKRMREFSTPDEVFAFFAENGFEFDEDTKQAILKDAEVIKKQYYRADAGELSEEELEQVAGGWSWGGAIFGGIMGALVTGIVVTLVMTNPMGAIVALGAMVSGGITGALTND